MAGVEGRTKTHELLRDGHVARALTEARQNPDPWYRCQSLTAVAAETADEARAAAILHEALRTAREQQEPNRIVSIASWPVGVYVGRGLGDLSQEVTTLLQIISVEPNPVRRADALLLLLGAVLPDAALREATLAPLLQVCSEARGWKIRRILQYASYTMAHVDAEAAMDILSRIPASREARRARKMVEEELQAGG